jgi:hypothetical protein
MAEFQQFVAVGGSTWSRHRHLGQLIRASTPSITSEGGHADRPPAR